MNEVIVDIPISVRAGKLLGMQRIFSEFSQTCPKTFCATIVSHKDRPLG